MSLPGFSSTVSKLQRTPNPANVYPAVVAGANAFGGTGGTDTLAKFVDTGGIEVFWRCRNSYIADQHIYMAGVTSPDGFDGATVAFGHTSAPTGMMCSEWTSSKMGSPPLIPDPNQSDANWMLLLMTVEPLNITVGPDGVTPLYIISGKYYYGARNPALVIPVFPRPPYIADDFVRAVPAGSLLPNLIETSESLTLNDGIVPVTGQ